MLELSLFQDSEETDPSAEKTDTSYESQADFHWEKKLKNPMTKNQKPNKAFSSSANSQFFLWKFRRLVLGFVGLIDAKGIDVAQSIWLSGGLT